MKKLLERHSGENILGKQATFLRKSQAGCHLLDLRWTRIFLITYQKGG